MHFFRFIVLCQLVIVGCTSQNPSHQEDIKMSVGFEPESNVSVLYFRKSDTKKDDKPFFFQSDDVSLLIDNKNATSLPNINQKIPDFRGQKENIVLYPLRIHTTFAKSSLEVKTSLDEESKANPVCSSVIPAQAVLMNDQFFLKLTEIFILN